MRTLADAQAWLHAIAAGRVEFHDSAFLYDNLLVSSYDQQILRELSCPDWPPSAAR